MNGQFGYHLVFFETILILIYYLSLHVDGSQQPKS